MIGSLCGARAAAHAALAGLLLLLSTHAFAYSSTSKANILYVGDSIASETGDMVGFWIQSTGSANFSTLAYAGTAICDWNQPVYLPPLNGVSQLFYAVMTRKPNLIIMQFVGNPSQIDANATASPPYPGSCMNGFAPTQTATAPLTITATPGTCMVGMASTQAADQFSSAYYAKYCSDAITAENSIAYAAQLAGIPKPTILWVLQGPDYYNPGHAQLLNEIYQYIATTFGDHTSDAGYEVSWAAFPAGASSTGPPPRYQWPMFLPCTAFEQENNNWYCTQPNSGYGPVTQLHQASANSDDGGYDTNPVIAANPTSIPLKFDPVHFCLGTDFYDTSNSVSPNPPNQSSSSTYGGSYFLCDATTVQLYEAVNAQPQSTATSASGTPIASPGIVKYAMHIASDANQLLGIGGSITP